ncbi:flagellar protein G [Oxyplasma meridianum]|uniref:Flagellar protein G n=1 Tax=Oxyplasma meridianum TaxID=3073602 RepID=A0AAX4NEZ7_9ARCH
MASIATSEMIMFIATMVLTASVVGVLGGETLHLSNSLTDSSASASTQIQTDFKIINDPSQIPKDKGYVFYVKNTGQVGFDFTNNTVSTIINGSIVTGGYISYITPAGSNGELMPSQVGTIVVNVTLSPGYHTIVITLNDGVTQQMVFEID